MSKLKVVDPKAGPNYRYLAASQVVSMGHCIPENPLKLKP